MKSRWLPPTHTCTCTYTHIHTHTTSPVGPHLPACHLSVSKPRLPIPHCPWMHACYCRKMSQSADTALFAWNCLSVFQIHCYLSLESSVVFLRDVHVTCVNQCPCRNILSHPIRKRPWLWNVSFQCELKRACSPSNWDCFSFLFFFLLSISFCKYYSHVNYKNHAFPSSVFKLILPKRHKWRVVRPAKRQYYYHTLK